MKRIATTIITTECCSYGCGNIAKFKNRSGNLMCEEVSNRCPEIIKKNSNGIKSSYSKRKPQKKIYQDLSQETKDKMAWSRGKHPGTIFRFGGRGNHKSLLISERGHKCEECNLEEWLNNKITLELDHIDGDNKNNEKNNLRLLCPNCHSYTPTWRGRNLLKKKTKDYVSDEEFLESLNNSMNIRQALLKLNLTPKGANYERANRLLYATVVK